MKNEFDLHENVPVVEMYFDMNCFTRRLVLTQRKEATWKWPIHMTKKSIPYLFETFGDV